MHQTTISVHFCHLPLRYERKCDRHSVNCTCKNQGPVVQSIVSQLKRPLKDQLVNPLVMSGLSHPYHLGESTFILRGARSKFSFLSHFSMKLV